jgi:hypothetical protein
MSQQQSGPPVDYGANLDKRLADLDEVDRKIAELMDTTKEIIGNLEKDKQVTCFDFSQFSWIYRCQKARWTKRSRSLRGRLRKIFSKSYRIS